MAESSSSAGPSTKEKKTIIPDPPPQKKKFTSKDKGKGKLIHDFHFKLRSTTIFHHAIAALFNHKFNPSRLALFEVDDSGLAITVYNATQSEPGCEVEKVNGYLRLHADYFTQFECVIPVSKMICLGMILVSLSLGKAEWPLSVFSRHESDLVTFAFEPENSEELFCGLPSDVELTDARPGYPRFPDIIYGFKASLPTSELIPLIAHILTLPPASLPDFLTLDLLRAKVRLIVGKNIVEKPADNTELWFVWPFWETLLRAASTSKECSIYQTTEPPEHLMLLFKLSDADDTMTFSKGTYICNKNVSCLAFLSALT